MDFETTPIWSEDALAALLDHESLAIRAWAAERLGALSRERLVRELPRLLTGGLSAAVASALTAFRIPVERALLDEALKALDEGETWAILRLYGLTDVERAEQLLTEHTDDASDDLEQRATWVTRAYWSTDHARKIFFAKLANRNTAARLFNWSCFEQAAITAADLPVLFDALAVLHRADHPQALAALEDWLLPEFASEEPVPAATLAHSAAPEVREAVLEALRLAKKKKWPQAYAAVEKARPAAPARPVDEVVAWQQGLLAELLARKPVLHEAVELAARLALDLRQPAPPPSPTRSLPERCADLIDDPETFDLAREKALRIELLAQPALLRDLLLAAVAAQGDLSLYVTLLQTSNRHWASALLGEVRERLLVGDDWGEEFLWDAIFELGDVAWLDWCVAQWRPNQLHVAEVVERLSVLARVPVPEGVAADVARAAVVAEQRAWQAEEFEDEMDERFPDEFDELGPDEDDFEGPEGAGLEDEEFGDDPLDETALAPLIHAQVRCLKCHRGSEHFPSGVVYTPSDDGDTLTFMSPIVCPYCGATDEYELQVGVLRRLADLAMQYADDFPERLVVGSALSMDGFVGSTFSDLRRHLEALLASARDGQAQATAHLRLGNVWRRAGEPARARAHWEKAYALDRENAEVIEVLRQQAEPESDEGLRLRGEFICALPAFGRRPEPSRIWEQLVSLAIEDLLAMAREPLPWVLEVKWQGGDVTALPVAAMRDWEALADHLALHRVTSLVLKQDAAQAAQPAPPLPTFAARQTRHWDRGERPAAKPAAAPAVAKVGRNEQCPCGSGLKFKKCHGK